LKITGTSQPPMDGCTAQRSTGNQR
jgi:hypothetical protein